MAVPPMLIRAAFVVQAGAENCALHFIKRKDGFERD